jgi:glycosyltransferase involved in cell wall biosynthesis
MLSMLMIIYPDLPLFWQVCYCVNLLLQHSIYPSKKQASFALPAYPHFSGLKKLLSIFLPLGHLSFVFRVLLIEKHENWVFLLLKFNLEGKQYILSVGRLSEKQKHFSVLIHALRLLIAKGHKLDLVIVGNGPDQQAYENYSRKCNVKQNVHLLTAVSDIDLKTVYENCEFFVLPSCFEGLPLVLLEAMSYGKPSIATNVGGVCEVIENGFNGIIVNPSFDNGYLEIEKLLLAPHTKNMLGEKSRQTVMKRFSERNCKATVSFLENISNTIDDR